ncbi:MULTISPECIES: hypothetical protein [unclassified Methylobacterium]|uniref:hypothetical protein n=1 Tax=unclassified Methylobacterium TaxID=2615210 RepID=UPI00226AEE1A|nr:MULTISPECIES: hypothetical protein [unclassified Methylobacterium]
MTPEAVPPLRGKLLAALRAVAANPGGLRIQSHPSVMPLLVEMGLVRLRDCGEPAWLLTDTGRKALARLRRDET